MLQPIDHIRRARASGADAARVKAHHRSSRRLLAGACQCWLVIALFATPSCEPKRHIPKSTSVASAQPAHPSRDPKFVSLVRLLASPETFDGVLVGAQGFVSFDFEGTALYLSETDYLNGLMENALWLAVDDEHRAAMNDHQYCLAVGRFDAAHRGHMGVFTGTLIVEDIRGCREPIKSEHEKLLEHIPH